MTRARRSRRCPCGKWGHGGRRGAAAELRRLIATDRAHPTRSTVYACHHSTYRLWHVGTLPAAARTRTRSTTC